MDLFSRFSSVRVINLLSRPDRASECMAEFKKHAMGTSNLSFYRAVKPTTKPDNWANYTLGCYGAYISHLTVLKEFLASGQESVLILEDDIKLLAPRSQYLDLIPSDWNLLHFGRCDKPATPFPQEGWRTVSAREGIQGLHCYAVNRKGAAALVKFLQEAGARQDGDKVGGPAHVDGIISMARADAGLRCYILEPFIAHFRASATDIHDDRMARFSRLPVLGTVLAVARKVKNSFGIKSRATIGA